jgi:hypothetical protein
MNTEELAATAAVPSLGIKAAVFSSDLPRNVLDAIEERLREAGCERLEEYASIDEVVTFDCSKKGCPQVVNPQIRGTSLAVVDQQVAGVPGLEVFGVLRSLNETRETKVIFLGPHGIEDWPNDHRTAVAAWGVGVDCYLARRDVLKFNEEQLERLVKYARALLNSQDGDAAA